MSTGKRLAKRSIIGTRVCAKWTDGIFYSGVIQEVHSPCDLEVNVLHHNPETLYRVLFDGIPISTALAAIDDQIYRSFDVKFIRAEQDFSEFDLIGSGFQSLAGYHSLTGNILLPGQRVYLTYNGREVSGIVCHHRRNEDEVVVQIKPPGQEFPIEVRKRLDEVRLLQSRKSARLMDQDTDFARLADMACDRRKSSSHCIDVPLGHGSRKRRTSSSNDEKEHDCMNECTAALVLMSLSCSPHSPYAAGFIRDHLSPSPSSDVYSWRSGGRSPTPSPPLSEASSFWAHNTTDEGIVIDDFEDIPRKKRHPQRIEYRCTWPGCNYFTTEVSIIERHVRQVHIGPKNEDIDSDLSDHEEEFYYTEVEISSTEVVSNTNPPVHPHKDMCRPPHEDPEYQRTRGFSVIRTAQNTPAANAPWGSSNKHMRMGSYAGNQMEVQSRTITNRTYSHAGSEMVWQPSSLPMPTPGKMHAGRTLNSPTRRTRGDTKKCRKVYGMEHRELWCTQCKWKKACSRFGD